MDEEEKDMIPSRMGIKTVQSHFGYLGLPVVLSLSPLKWTSQKQFVKLDLNSKIMYFLYYIKKINPNLIEANFKINNKFY